MRVTWTVRDKRLLNRHQIGMIPPHRRSIRSWTDWPGVREPEAGIGPPGNRSDHADDKLVKRIMRVFLADPGLVNFSGHFFNYIQCLIGPFQDAGHDVHVLGNRQMIPDVVAATRGIPTFIIGLDHQLGHLGDRMMQAQQRHALLREAASNIPMTEDAMRIPEIREAVYDWGTAWNVDAWREAFEDLDRQFHLTDRDLLIINSLQHNHMIGLAEWAGRRAGEQGQGALPRFVIILHQSLRTASGVHQARAIGFHHAFGLISKAGLENHFHIFSDSEILSAEYSAVTSMPVGVLPIPHSAPALAFDRPDRGTPGLCYVGTACLARGFQFLPSVVTHLSPAIHGAQVRVEIQAQLGSSTDSEIRAACERLRQFPITLHEDALSLEDYHGILNRADICLIPSLRPLYQAQTSGVFLEAVSFGKVVVIPEGTWMSTMAHRYGIGVTFEAGDATSLCRAVDNALTHLDVLAPRAQAATVEWNKVNSPAGFIETLARRVEGVLGPGNRP